MSRIISRIMPLLLLTLISGGCLPYTEVDETAYAISIIVDKSEMNRVKVGLRIPVPRLIGKVQGQPIGGGGAPGQGLYVSTSVHAPTILAGIDMMQLYVARTISLEHARALLISEALAREGIEDQVTPLLRYQETRSNMYVLITKGDPMRLVDENQPLLEVSISRYIELLARNADLTSLAARTRVGELYNDIKSHGSDGVAGILAINEEILAARTAQEREQAGGSPAPDDAAQADISTKAEMRLGETEDIQAPDPPIRTAGSFTSGNLPREGGNVVEWVGLAVFSRDKMVGELNGNEAMAYRLLRGNFIKATFSVALIDRPDQLVTVVLYPGRHPRVETRLEEDQATVNVKLVVEADLLYSTAGQTFASDGIGTVERSVEHSLKAWIDSTVKKTQQWQADIFGFGEHFRRHFLTWQAWEKTDWHQLYKNATVNVDLDVTVRRPGLILEASQVD